MYRVHSSCMPRAGICVHRCRQPQADPYAAQIPAGVRKIIKPCFCHGLVQDCFSSLGESTGSKMGAPGSAYGFELKLEQQSNCNPIEGVRVWLK